MSVFKTWYEEWSHNREALLADAWRIVEGQVKFFEQRNAFFEKLMLFATGSFALSLTFLSTLRGHAAQGQPLNALWCLEFAWILMLTSGVCSGLHNLHRTYSSEKFYNGASKKLLGVRCTIIQVQMNKLAAQANSSDESSNKEQIEGGASQLKQITDDTVKDAEGLFQQANDSSGKASKLANTAVLSLEVGFIWLLVFAIKNAALL